MSGFINIRRLRERGWSRSMIRKLLDPPDRTERNPECRSAAPSKLYREERVGEAEAIEQFTRLRSAAARRATTSRTTAARRAKDLIEWARTVRIEWREPPPDDATAIEEGIASWEARNHAKASGVLWPTMQRWARNYLRHECLQYEDVLTETTGRPGVDTAYEIIRKRCDDMIEERYPTL